MFYLYLKTHNVTGLKYLGFTSNKDPHLYRGSGKRWKYHIQKHGYNVSTEILFENKSMEEIKPIGLYYSKMWNIVESDEFANLMPETCEINCKGMTTVKDPLTGEILKVSVTDTRFTSGALVGMHSGMTPAKDPLTGKTSQVSVDDPRYVSGELKHIFHGMTSAKDPLTGEIFHVSVTDPRFASGALVGLAKGTMWIHNPLDNKHRMIFNTDIIPEGWVKGRTTGIRKRSVS